MGAVWGRGKRMDADTAEVVAHYLEGDLRAPRVYPVELDSGSCSQSDPEAFHPEQGSGAFNAKRMCGGCPVRATCLEYALTTDERYGVWGGMSERERTAWRLQRNAGR
jgi:hypothetical protein